MSKTLGIGFILFLVGVLSMFYWFFTAPYCCIHDCCCTTSIMDCIFGNIAMIILLFGVILMVISQIVHEAPGEKK